MCVWISLSLHARDETVVDRRREVAERARRVVEEDGVRARVLPDLLHHIKVLRDQHKLQNVLWGHISNFIQNLSHY